MANLQSRSVRRREDVRLLTGRGNYAADPHPAGLLHAVLVRSHHAHAAVGNIDTTAARAMPGVAPSIHVFFPRGDADIATKHRYIHPARHVRAFGVALD